MPLEIIEINGGITFSIRVVPRASKSEIVGESEGILRIRISAPLVDGAANDEVVRVLAKAVGVAKSNLAIVSGQTSKTKRIGIVGVSAAQLQKMLGC